MSVPISATRRNPQRTGLRVRTISTILNHALLELNIAVNGLDGQIVASRCAIGDAVGMATLQPGPPENFGTTRVVAGAGETPVRSLAIPGPVRLIKIDVKGEELPVLPGAATVIQAWLFDIMIEADNRQAFSHLADAMLQFGYVPRGRFAVTVTWLFSATDQVSRMRRVLAAQGGP